MKCRYISDNICKYPIQDTMSRCNFIDNQRDCKNYRNILFFVKVFLYNSRRKLFKKHRTTNVINFIKASGKTNLICTEIGVDTGLASYIILENLPVKQMYLIDPYNTKKAGWYYKDDAYESCKKKMQKYGNKVKFIKKCSHNAVENFPDNYFDFVRYEAIWDYDYAFKELESWLKKVKYDGVLSGEGISGSNINCLKVIVHFIDNHPELVLMGCSNEWWVVKKESDGIK